MEPTTRPIKTLVVVAFALHIVALMGVAAMVSLQNNALINIFLQPICRDSFVTPPLTTVAMYAFFFIVHGFITWGIIANLRDATAFIMPLRVLAGFAFVFIVVLMPIVSHVEARFASSRFTETNDIISYIRLMNRMENVLTIRNIALSLVLLAAGMIFYYGVIISKPPR